MSDQLPKPCEAPQEGLTSVSCLPESRQVEMHEDAKKQGGEPCGNHIVVTEAVPSDLLCRPPQQLSPLKKQMASTAQLSLVFLIKGIRRGISKLYDNLNF